MYLLSSRLRNMDRRYRNILLSVGLILLLCVIINFLPIEADFAAAGIVMATALGALGLACLSFLIRLMGYKISKTHFLYAYVGTLNAVCFLVCGVSCLYRGFPIGGFIFTALYLGTTLIIFRDIFF